ncbi:MAG: efflux RND transporter permease subunit [Acidobacteria bacterium]|nr:efflux RND transporter permease subunit [Acidobacteriota bacterium]MXZ70414.1 efflux RND transporter permease subunit [Acidobacteriota bacterium]MYJ06319.1 efflux RND transporter permease subunit [Acidobacteriota bacterium]
MTSTDTDRAAQPAEARKGLIAYFAGNPVAANLLMLVLIAGGVASGCQLAVQNFPEIDLRMVHVTVLSPGSSPQEVEQDINRRVEESVIGLAGVERVVATATEGVGRINIEMATFADAGSVLNDVRNAVDAIENFPPLNAEQPEIRLAQLSIEAMTLAVSSSVVGENELRLAAENVRDELLGLPSVSLVTLRGTRDREIAIELSEEELRRNDLSIADVSAAVQRASLNLTFGELRTESGGVVLHTVAKRSIGEEFEDIPLITRLNGTIVKLGDVAEIRDGFVEDDVVSEVNGTPAVFIRVDATERQSIVDMGDDIRSWLADYEPPQDVAIGVWNDRAQPAIDRMSAVARNGLAGAILVFLLLVLVFDLRAATWMAIGIPFSFVGALTFFAPANLTLNIGTLLGFFLMIGLVVDDALVVGESIATERDRGKRGAEAATSGAKAVVGPITIGACTTILAFVPFLFVTASLTQFVNVFPYVAFFVLTVSLVEAFFILPAHLSHDGNWSLGPLRALQVRVCAWLDQLRERTVAPAVAWSVRNVWPMLAGGAVLVLFSLLLLGSEVVRIILFDEEMNIPENVQVDLRLPAGTPFGTTLAAAEQVAAAAHAMNEQLPGESISGVSILAGNVVSSRTGTEEPNGSHLAGVRIHLNGRPARQVSPAEIERVWRENIGELSHLETMEFQRTSVRPRPSVAYALKHDDAEVLRAAAGELRSYLGTMPGIYEIADSLSLGKRHLEIELTPAGEAAGLTPTAIGAALRAKFHGVEVQRIQRGHEELQVVVRYPRERRRNLRELANERVRRVGGGEVPLSVVADLSESREQATLMRIDGNQAATVEARADAAIVTPLQARRQVEREIIPELLAEHPDLTIEPAGGVRDERAMLETLGFLVPVVLIAMYALMAAFLRSYWKPLVAVAGFPISFAGAVLAHWVLGWDLTAMSLLGLIAVFGVIVNDALVLLDRYNTLRRENAMLPAIAAAAAAARHRFRAVFLTSATTILGLSPLLYERSDDLVFVVPFVVSMVGGLVLSGAFILFLLPTLVMIAEGGSE